MRASFINSVRCVLVLLASLSAVLGQTSPATPPASDAAITALSVMGVVTDFKPATREVTVATAAGNPVTVTLSDRTQFMRIPPGEKARDKFVKISPTDFGLGDSVFARGRMSEDRKSLPALEFYVMSKGEIAQKRDREREEWSTRGVAGTVSALNAEAKEISLASRTPEGPKPVVIAANANTRFRRYAPDSVRFSDAKASSFAELRVGDQIRALGTKSNDGSRFTPDEIVSGEFQTISGPITEISVERSEIKINDLQSHQQVTVVVSKDSVLRRLTPELLAVLMSAKPTTSSGSTPPPPGANPTKGGGDLQEMFDQLPMFSLQELKAGDALLVSSTKGAASARVTAIAVVSGVGPLVQNGQSNSKSTVALGAMSLGGP